LQAIRKNELKQTQTDIMKKSIVLSIVTMMAIMAQAETWSLGGGTMYFDNSQTQWNEAKMMLVIGNECWSEVVEMQPAGQANLWVAALPSHWNGPSYMAVLNGTDMWGQGTWGSANLQNASHYSAAYLSGLVSIATDAYIFVPQSAENGCELTLYRKGEEPQPEPEPEYHWFVKGDFNEWAGQAFAPQQGGEANTVYATVQLPAGKEYVFKLQGYETWYGNSGMMTQANHTGWTFGSDNQSNCALITTIGGDYIFALDTTTMSLTVQYPNNPKQSTLYDSPVKDQNTDVMLQAFYWAHVGNTGEEYTQFGDVKWSALNAEAAEIAANFDLVWLAPSQETADYTGYLPINYSKQGQVSGNTQGHSPWGSGQDLKNLIQNLHQGGAKVIADIVLNHSSASHPDEYTGPNYNWCTWGTMDFCRYGQFNPNYTWICKGDEMFYGKKNVYGNDCGYNDNTDLEEDEMKVSYQGGETWWAESEFNCMYSRDWAHKKKEVREMSRAFLTWMRDSIGYDGFRYDFMKGIHGSHLNDYNRASAPYFSVAELFDGDIDKQLGYLQDANYSTYVFDFPGKFTIYDAAIREYKLQNLKNNGNTLIYGPYKKYAVTFCDNHDSFHEEGKSLNYHANTIDDRQAHQALAYLLSMPGVPCVMYPYWHNYKAECKAFIQARRAVGVHSESTVVQDWAGSGVEGDNYYTALIQGTNGQLFLKLGYDCNPLDAPMVAAPAGKRWQCAWANRDHAGVWYTVDADEPTNVPAVQDNTQQTTKVLKEGQIYIQQDEQVYTVQGQAVK
jgi:alpha-amylase